MDRQKVLSLLGLCRKAGKAGFGHDAALSAVRSNSAHLCLLSQDASERLEKEFRRVCAGDGRKIAVQRLPMSMEEIGAATGLPSAVLTINDMGFCELIAQQISSCGEDLYDQ